MRLTYYNQDASCRRSGGGEGLTSNGAEAKCCWRLCVLPVVINDLTHGWWHVFSTSANECETAVASHFFRFVFSAPLNQISHPPERQLAY